MWTKATRVKFVKYAAKVYYNYDKNAHMQLTQPSKLLIFNI